MYDADQDDEITDSSTLTLGQRYAGQRKPSELFTAMLPDLEWLQHVGYAMGLNSVQAIYPYYEVMAWRELCRSNPDYDITLTDDTDDQEWLGVPDGVENMVIEDVVRSTIRLLNRYTPDYTFYGWRSDDPDAGTYENFGVWIDWAKLGNDLDAGRVIRVDSPYEDLAAIAKQADAGTTHALWDAEGDLSGDLVLYDLSSQSTCWSA